MEPTEKPKGTSSEDIGGKIPKLVRTGEDHIIDPSADLKDLLKKGPEEVNEEREQDDTAEKKKNDLSRR